MATRTKYDLAAPGTRELTDRIVHGAFVTEGTMVAFPPCFPGVTQPPPADECHIRCMDATPSGNVYAGTGGRAAHLLVGMFHGVTGMVLDMGAVAGAVETAAICCGETAFVAAVNGPGGGRLILRELEELPFDLIQEWHIRRPPLQDLGVVAAGEAVVHAVADGSRRAIVGITEGHLFHLGTEERKVGLVAPIPGRGRLVLGPGNVVWGMDEGRTLWAYEVDGEKLSRRALALPEGSWEEPSAVRWAPDPAEPVLYLADAGGLLYSFTSSKGFTALGRTPVAPVSAMAATFDGRLYGAMGSGMCKLFCYDPSLRKVAGLGVAVSVFERRRYGYTFGDAVLGRDGEIIFGEDDDLGHLWLYYPRIRREGKAR